MSSTGFRTCSMADLARARAHMQARRERRVALSAARSIEGPTRPWRSRRSYGPRRSRENRGPAAFPGAGTMFGEGENALWIGSPRLGACLPMAARPMTAETQPQPDKPVGADDRVILVDGSSFIFRAYFQSINQDQKYNTRPSDGLPTGAVRLFCTKIAQFLQDGAAGVKRPISVSSSTSPRARSAKSCFPTTRATAPTRPTTSSARCR